MDEILVRFGANLRAARERSGLTQAAFGREIGMDQSYLSRIEQGTVNLTVETMVQLANAVNADVLEMMASDASESPPHR